MPERPGCGDQPEPGPFRIAAELLDDHRAAAVAVAVRRGPGKGPRGVGIRAGRRHHAHVAPGQVDEDHRAVAGGGFDHRRGRLAAQQIRQSRRVHDSPDDRIVGVGGRDDVFARADRGQQAAGILGVGGVALRAELLEDADRLVEMAFGDRARAGLRHEASEREVAEGGLIALAEQIEQRRALREVVVRVGRAPAFGVEAAAQPQIFPPRRGRHLRIERLGGGRQPLLGLGQPAGARQRFGGDQGGLQGVERGSARVQDFVGAGDRVVEIAAPHRQARTQDADRPFVPLAGLPSERAVGVAGARQILGSGLVRAADHVNLREGVEDGAGGLVKLDRAAHVERAVQRVFGAGQVAETDADLAEGGQRDRQAVAGPQAFVQHHAPLGQRERLLVAVLHHHHAGLVAAHGCQDVVGPHRRGKPLGVAQGGHRLVVFADLREQDARQRVHEREMAPIACGVKRGRGLGDVLAHDGGVADAAVAMRQLVVGESDCARVVRGLGLFERALVERDGPRLIAAR